MGYRQTGGRNSTVRSPTNAMSMTKGTFSQAGKPRVNTAGNAFDMMSKRSLYQKIVAENIDANRSYVMSSMDKRNVGRSFKNAQKTFAKCQTMADITN